MLDFSLTRDFKIVQWTPTLVYNLLRSTSAGIVWAILSLLLMGGVGNTMSMLLFPVIYLLFFMPIGLAAHWLGRVGVPFAGLVAAILAFFVAIGDPLVYLLDRVKPGIIPIERPPFFQLSLVIFVFTEEVEAAKATLQGFIE